MTPQEFVDTIIAPALVALGLDSVPARQLLLGTALQESGLRDIDQIGGGPAKGDFQIEPATRADVLNWVEHTHVQWFDAVEGLDGPVRDAAIARLIYERAPGVIGVTPEAQAAYYKHWYNTPLGKATVAEYLANWKLADGVDFTTIPLAREEPPKEVLSAVPTPTGDAVSGDLGGLTEPVTEVVDQGELPPVGELTPVEAAPV